MALTPITMTGSTDTLKEGFTKVNDIIDDLAAVTTGLGASCIGVFDTAGNMAATDVEAALAEIYTDVTSARTLSDIFDENAATTTGLTWGWKAGSIRVDNTVTAVAADTISVTDDSVNYIEISQAGVVSRNGTGFTSGRIPIRQVTAAAGVQTVSIDKRAWFVQINLAVPGPIGGTTPAAGAFTTLSATGIITATGGQIALPAAAVPSADPNTLDDYEEGTFTPTILLGGTPVTSYIYQDGFYTKIGNRMFFNLYVTVNAIGAGTGAVTIGGLPGTALANERSDSSVSVFADYLTGITGQHLIGIIAPSTSSVAIFYLLNTRATALPHTVMDAADTVFKITGTYMSAHPA